MSLGSSVFLSSPEPRQDFIVLNKPSGWSIHNESPSLQEALAAQGLGKLHFINRLDRETSGVVLATAHADKVEALKMAMHGSAQAGKSDELSKKIYRGITRNPKQESLNGLWSEALSDKAEGRREPLGKSSDRVPARTRWQVLASNDWFWDLEFELYTGRQHQIRKHCAFHGMPLAGDPRYGREAFNRKIQETYGISRMFLHAWKLHFPWKGEQKIYEAPLPSEFSRLLSDS